MFDLNSWDDLNGSAWRTKFTPNLTYNLTKGQELEQYANSYFGVYAYPTAIIIGVDYTVRHLDAAWPVAILAGNLDAAIAEMPTIGIDDLNSSNGINSFTLNQNYPNPFNPSTLISFSTKVNQEVKLTVYDATGVEVSIIANGFYSKGDYSFNFDATKLNSGVYYYKIETEKGMITKKMMLLK